MSALPNVKRATCVREDVDEQKGATYTLTFNEWPREAIDARDPHKGNPPLDSFKCDVSGFSS